MQQYSIKYFANRPPTLGMESVGQNSSFLEHGHGLFTYLFTLTEVPRGIPTLFHIWLTILETVYFQGMY